MAVYRNGPKIFCRTATHAVLDCIRRVTNKPNMSPCLWGLLFFPQYRPDKVQISAVHIQLGELTQPDKNGPKIFCRGVTHAVLDRIWYVTNKPNMSPCLWGLLLFSQNRRDKFNRGKCTQYSFFLPHVYGQTSRGPLVVRKPPTAAAAMAATTHTI